MERWQSGLMHCPAKTEDLIVPLVRIQLFPPMNKPIEPTPILEGADARRFLEDFDRVNKLMENPEYRKKQIAYLEKCRRLYENFCNR